MTQVKHMTKAYLMIGSIFASILVRFVRFTNYLMSNLLHQRRIQLDLLQNVDFTKKICIYKKSYLGSCSHFIDNTSFGQFQFRQIKILPTIYSLWPVDLVMQRLWCIVVAPSCGHQENMLHSHFSLLFWCELVFV